MSEPVVNTSGATQGRGCWETCKSYLPAWCGGSSAPVKENEYAPSTSLSTGSSSRSKEWISQDTINTAKFCFTLAVVNAVIAWRNEKVNGDNKVWTAVAIVGSGVVLPLCMLAALVEGIGREAIGWFMIALVNCRLIEATGIYTKFDEGGRLAILTVINAGHASCQNFDPKHAIDVEYVYNSHPVLNTVFDLRGCSTLLTGRIGEINKAAAAEQSSLSDRDEKKDMKSNISNPTVSADKSKTPESNE